MFPLLCQEVFSCRSGFAASDLSGAKLENADEVFLRAVIFSLTRTVFLTFTSRAQS